jgi:hypothetical protein
MGLMISFALLFLSASEIFGRFFLPEAASLSVTVLEASRFAAADRLLVQPPLLALAGWLSPFRSFETLWPSICALAGTVLAGILINALRFARHKLISIFFFIFVLLSYPVLFLLTTDPASALGIAFLAVALKDLLSHLRTGHTFPLFSAGLALGLIPFAAPWGLYVVLCALVLTSFLIEVEEHGFFAEYIVLFTPFLLFGAGWWFLHWVYGKGSFLYTQLSFPLSDAAAFPVSAAVLAVAVIFALVSIRCGEDKADCAVAFRLFFLSFASLGIAWLVLPAGEVRLRISLLSGVAVLIFLARVLLPVRRCPMLWLCLLLFCVVSWWEMPLRSKNMARWNEALRGEGFISRVYPAEEPVGRYLRERLPGASVGVEGRGAAVVEFFAAGKVRFVPQYETPTPPFSVRPAFLPPSADERVVTGSGQWLLLERTY